MKTAKVDSGLSKVCGTMTKEAKKDFNKRIARRAAKERSKDRKISKRIERIQKTIKEIEEVYSNHPPAYSNLTSRALTKALIKHNKELISLMQQAIL